jgi:thymidylate synthase
MSDMYLKANTLDDLLHRVLSRLLSRRGKGITASRGATLERTGVLLHLSNPRARLSRTARRSQIFSCLGELMWYLAGSNSVKFIDYYVPAYKQESIDGKTIPSAYGPRLFGDGKQVSTVVSLLKDRQNSRRAVIQIFDANDLLEDGAISPPCTCSLQFMVRNGRLHAFTSMRSNDAYRGLPHDVFAFTMLQELVANSLGVKLGTYKHYVGSLHLYESDLEAAQQYLDDGFQESFEMPPMPVGDQFGEVAKLLKIESKIRRKVKVNLDKAELLPYWKDVARLLRIYRFYRDNDTRGMARQMAKLSTTSYNQFVEAKRRHAELKALGTPVQRHLFAESSLESAG